MTVQSLPIAVIESPYAAKSAAGLQRNLAYARALVRHVAEKGYAPVASHLLLTQALDDRIEAHRDAGIAAGLALLRVANLHVFGVDLGFSRGMTYAQKATPAGVLVELLSLPEWAAALKASEVGNSEPMDTLVAANQPMWHAHETSAGVVEWSGMTLSRVLLPANMTPTQRQRLNGLLVEGAVVELAWLQSAAGLRKDSALQAMNALARSGACEVTTLIFHDCAEHNVATGTVEWPWECPDCEALLDSDDADQVHFEQRLTLTKPVRFL
jgi:hypothetical protein